MADLTATKSKHATLTGTTVDTVTFTRRWSGGIEVANRVGTATLWVTSGTVASPPATPTEGGDGTEFVMAGTAVVLEDAPTADPVVVKILGDGNAYSVRGIEE